MNQTTKLIMALTAFITLTSSLAYAGKVTWSTNGKPVIEEPTQPIEGCEPNPWAFEVEDNITSPTCG